tara:strand:- start:7761 stop:8459 length:699 start_codon:yes stop_codon:yes gene_type:complete
MSFIKSYARKFEMFRATLGKEDPVIVEVGAHYGEDSMRFVETFDNPVIHCFEPDPRNIEIFKKHIKSNAIILYEYALSNSPGMASFYSSYREKENKTVPEKYDWISKDDYNNLNLNNSGASSLKHGYGHLLDETISVVTRRGDDWINVHNIEFIDLLWIDVQGAEKEVLDGFGSELSRVKFIWTEYGEKDYDGSFSRDECISYLFDLGFVNVNSLSDKSQQGDLLFIHKRYT